jgi:NAD(P)-dependent dehydrogenase (short-subunit alcohol dehydrogenase family)
MTADAAQLRIELRDAVAVVTGGGAGLGRGIALALATAGAHVAVLDIDAERAASTAGEIEARGRRGLAQAVDVMDTDALRDAIETTAETFGRIDVLVNNAGGVAARPFLEQSERSWRRHIDINLVSMLAAISAAVPVMIAGECGGSIINVASIEGTRAAPAFAVYAACKAAMLNFTRTMALELAEHGIRVNAITPDWTRTPGNSGYRTGPVPQPLPHRGSELDESLRAYVPLGREGSIDECGNAVAFLCSPLAGYITGATIPIDGGTWASSGWVRTADGWSLFGPDRPM